MNEYVSENHARDESLREELSLKLSVLFRDDPSVSTVTGRSNSYADRDLRLFEVATVAIQLGYPVWFDRDLKPSHDDFAVVMYIQLPNGQVSWHLPNAPRDPAVPEEWDGHSLREKYERVANYLSWHDGDGSTAADIREDLTGMP